MRKEKLDFGPVHGRAGDVAFVPARPGLLFKGRQLVAEDSGGGHATVLRQIRVNGEEASPPGRTPMVAFGPNAVANEVTLPTCAPGEVIEIEIEFVADGTWWASLLGDGIA